jgi:hypothetical protein
MVDVCHTQRDPPNPLEPVRRSGANNSKHGLRLQRALPLHVGHTSTQNYPALRTNLAHSFSKPPDPVTTPTHYNEQLPMLYQHPQNHQPFRARFDATRHESCNSGTAEGYQLRNLHVQQRVALLILAFFNHTFPANDARDRALTRCFNIHISTCFDV